MILPFPVMSEEKKQSDRAARQKIEIEAQRDMIKKLNDRLEKKNKGKL